MNTQGKLGGDGDISVTSYSSPAQMCPDAKKLSSGFSSRIIKFKDFITGMFFFFLQ